MLKTLLALIRPLHTIAEELTIIRQLYEEELYKKHRIVRVTEKPTKGDTEVSYSGEEKVKVPLWKRTIWHDQEEEEPTE